jgi:hypothetical protein
MWPRHAARELLDLIDLVSPIGLTMAFQLVCARCDSVGVIIDHGELAPASTIIRCSHCEAARGTLGELRHLATSDRRDLFDAAAPRA